jgi:hypothetical protein
VQGLETTGSIRREIVLIENIGAYYTKSRLTAFLAENRNRYILLWTVLTRPEYLCPLAFWTIFARLMKKVCQVEFSIPE